MSEATKIKASKEIKAFIEIVKNELASLSDHEKSLETTLDNKFSNIDNCILWWLINNLYDETGFRLSGIHSKVNIEQADDMEYVNPNKLAIDSCLVFHFIKGPLKKSEFAQSSGEVLLKSKMSLIDTV